MNQTTPRSFGRFFTVNSAALFIALSLSGCMFLDDEGPGADGRIRGYTECGDFMGETWCAPGESCSDWGWSECSLGCLSDVNCASNQVCVNTPSEPIGVCMNAVSREVTER